MQVKLGNQITYDDFTIGIAESRDPSDRTVNIAFREMDYEGTAMEQFGPIHIFRIAPEKIDDLIQMLQAAKGAKIHLPSQQDISAMNGRK